MWLGEERDDEILKSLNSTDRIQALVAANVDGVADNRRRGVDAVVEGVLADHLERRAVLEHERGARTGGDVDPPRGADRRREHLVEAVQPLCLVVRLAGLRVEGRQNSR